MADGDMVGSAAFRDAALASPSVDELAADDPIRILKDLRAARRRRRIVDFDPFEALYRAYLTGITLTMVVLALSSITGDGKVSPAQVTSLSHHGGPAIGLAVALVWAIGLRSGGRGGPLVVEAADVRHVLLSPVDRAVALRGPAIRQLRFLVLVGVTAGGIAGLLAFRRLPGAPAAWMATGAVVGATAVAAGFGLAMMMSGLRFGRWLAGAAALLVLAWSGADVWLRTATSPASLLGRLALWPLTVQSVDVLGPLVALAAAGAGLALIGGTSLEASERRASLVGQIRFAATLQDLRTVIVLRRQLAQESPRQRPWIRLPRAVPKAWLVPTPRDGPAGSRAPGPAKPEAVAGPPRPGRVHVRWFPVWRRGWHGILRWPALRFGRVAVLGAVAGLALVGVWNGTTPLVIVAGLALYVAGLDAAEPLAQEVDHPDRRDSYDVVVGSLHLRQLGAPAVLMVLVATVGVLAAAAATGGASTTWRVGAAMLVPAAMCGLAAAATSVIKGAPPPLSSQAALVPEAAGARAMGRLLWPLIMAVIGVLPIMAARDAFAHHQPIVPAVVGVEQLVALLILGFLGWVRYQEDAHAWWQQQMGEVSKAAKSGSAAG